MRCNVGIDPVHLTDQWLIAEYRELPMVIGSLRYYNWTIKTEARDVFDLGTGHINWFKRRLVYLHRRHECVKREMTIRNFKCDVLSIKLDEYADEFKNDWNPTIEDSRKIRERLVAKLLHNENNLPVTWWRINRINLTEESVHDYVRLIRECELFPV